MHVQFLAFTGVAALITITPGADMAVVTRIALTRGRRAAWFAGAGITNGLLCWAVASGAGLAALLSASATAYAILRTAGAVYLIYLGLASFAHARHQTVPQEVEAAPPPATERPVTGAWPSYRQGLLSNLLNPKIAVFYTSFLPQFIGPGDPVFEASLLLAGIHMVIGVFWLTGYATLVARAGDALRRPRVKAALDRLTGLVLIGFGLRLGLER